MSLTSLHLMQEYNRKIDDLMEEESKARRQNYLDKVNHPNFREASYAVDHARSMLKDMGMTQSEAYGWIKAWASGAGDGSE